MEENRTNTVVTDKPAAAPIAAPQGQYVPVAAQRPPVAPATPYQSAPVNNLPPRGVMAPPPPKPEKSMAGLAFNIASMAIGTITFLIGVTSLTDVIEYLFEDNSWYSFGSELSTSVGCLIFGLLCLALAFIGIRKKENAGRSMGAVGIICGVLGILCSALSIILLLALY